MEKEKLKLRDMKKIRKYFILAVIPLVLSACAMSEKDNYSSIDVSSGKGGSLARFTMQVTICTRLISRHFIPSALPMPSIRLN
jgi:hypothetical protein